MGIRVWDAANGKPLGTLRGHDETVNSVVFSPDGTRIASGSDDHTILVWDAATMGEVGVLGQHRSAVKSVAFSTDGRRLVSAGEDHTLRVWDASSWLPMVGHKGDAFAEFEDDGRIVSGSADGTVRWWDAATGRLIGAPRHVNDDDVTSLWPLGENRLVSLGNAPDYTLRLWDAATGTAIGEFRQPHSPDGTFDYSEKSGRIAAETEPGLVQLFNADGMQPIGAPIKHEGLIDIRFSRDGRIVATGGSDYTVRLWDSSSGAAIGKPMTGYAYVNKIEFSRDRQLLAVSYADDTVVLWNIATREPIGDPMWVGSKVTALAISPDKRIVASGSTDGTIRLWDADHQTPRGPALKGHASMVLSLDFSPGGTTFVSGSFDRTLRVWPAPPASPAEALCAKITHNMTHEQWNNIVPPDIDYITVCPGLPESIYAAEP